MPGTATERNLLDPMNPVQALPKAAEFLKELRRQFGNIGLAAAAYNAGATRIREWMDGKASIPSETRAYVFAITGATVDEWAGALKSPLIKNVSSHATRQWRSLGTRPPFTSRPWNSMSSQA